jgi:hypothetical protein
MRVIIRGKLPSGSMVNATGAWPDGVPLMPGINVKFSNMGPRYVGEIESIIVDLGDETNGRPGQPTLVNVKSVRDATE